MAMSVAREASSDSIRAQRTTSGERHRKITAAMNGIKSFDIGIKLLCLFNVSYRPLSSLECAVELMLVRPIEPMLR